MATSTNRPITSPDMVHVFYDVTSGYFVSPNADYLPRLPTCTDRMNSIFDGLYSRYANDDWFYLALVPKQVPYDLPLFECLAPVACGLEYVETENSDGYRLKENIIKQWTALEGITSHVQKKLLQRTAGTYLETLVPPYPSSMGFWRIWATRSDALLAIRLTRAVFTLRFAFISWLVMNEMLKNRTVWVDLASDNNDPVPLSICNSFQASWISDFTVPRIGAFVDIGCQDLPDAGRQWHEEISTFIEFGVPIWFSYKHKPQSTSGLAEITTKYYKSYSPTAYATELLRRITQREYEFERTRDTDGQQATAMTNDSSSLYGYVRQFRSKPPTFAYVRRREQSTSTYSLRFPRGPGNPADITPITDSAPSHIDVEFATLQFRYRQQPRDTYEVFIERESQLKDRLSSTETEWERRKRIYREKANLSQPVPTVKGPVVYAWFNEGGQQVRTRVDPKDIPDLWRRTTALQRSYNAFRNEYDVLDDQTAAAHESHPRNNSAGRTRSASPNRQRRTGIRSRTPMREAGFMTKQDDDVTNTTPNSTRSEVKVMTTEVGTTTSLAGTMGDKGVVMAMRVGKVMRRVMMTMRKVVRVMKRVENATTRD